MGVAPLKLFPRNQGEDKEGAFFEAWLTAQEKLPKSKKISSRRFWETNCVQLGLTGMQVGHLGGFVWQVLGLEGDF